MTKDEALKLALEALEQHGTPFLHHEDAYSNSLNALRQAIADAEKQESDDLTIAYMSGFHDGKNTPQPKPEQEPVAWRSWNDKDKFGFWDTKAEAESWCDLDFDSEPLYTTPPQRKPLTDEQIFDLSEPFGAFQYGDAQGHKRLEFARAIEAAHGIKGE